MKSKKTRDVYDSEALPSFSISELFTFLIDLINLTDSSEHFPAVCILGTAGCGKTTIGKDLGRFLQRPVTFCNLAGMEAPDLIGIPQSRNGVVYFDRPWWFDHAEDMLADQFYGGKDPNDNKDYVKEIQKLFANSIPEEKKPERILVLDEVGRVTPDSFGPVMNVILEGMHQCNRMQKRTLIIATSNLSSGSGDEDYAVQEFDTAQKDRMIRIRLSVTFAEWKKWAASSVHPGVLAWAKNNQRAVRAFFPASGSISLRRLTKLGQALNRADKEFLGSKRLHLYVSAVVPALLVPGVIDQIRTSAENISAEDIADNYPEIRSKFVGSGLSNDLGIIMNLADELLSLLSSTKLSQDKVVNVGNFLSDCPSSVGASLLEQLCGKFLSTPTNEELQVDLEALAGNKALFSKCIYRTSQVVSEIPF